MSSGKSSDLKYVKTSNCVQYVTMTSRDGCPLFQIDYIYDFLNKYKVLWGVLFILVGLGVNFFGRVSIKPTVFTLTFIFVTFILLLFMYSVFMDSQPADWAIWLVLCVCAILGLTSGFLLTRMLRFGIAILGGCAGFAIGLVVNNLV